MAICRIPVWDAQATAGTIALQCPSCNRASFSSPTRPQAHVYLLRPLTKTSKEGSRYGHDKSTTLTCFSNTFSKWRVFNVADLPTVWAVCLAVCPDPRRYAMHQERAIEHDGTTIVVSLVDAGSTCWWLLTSYLSSLTRGLKECRVQGHFSCKDMFTVGHFKFHFIRSSPCLPRSYSRSITLLAKVI